MTVVLATAAVVAAAGPASAAPETAPAAGQVGAVLGLGAPDAIPGQFIVVYRDAAMPAADVPATTDRVAARYGARPVRRFDHALRGFAATMSPEQAARLATDPAVAYVEQDRQIHLDTVETPTPSWGLDRVDQHALPLDNKYGYASDGSGIVAYIIDTGINLTHKDFTGRIRSGYNALAPGTTANDCDGHGTHVAGTVGGTTYGVAKKVALVAVRVFGCRGGGSVSAVVAGVDWVTNDHTTGYAVANMSLGGDPSTALDQAVQNSIADGVTYVVSSGNDNYNACTQSPARVPQAITVNASTKTDARASFSNYGSCTDIFAPGENITSDWIGSTTATATISGTSMAAPHVTGAAALYLSGHPTAATPAQVASALYTNSTTDVVTDPGTGSPNRLLYATVNRPATLCSDVGYTGRCQDTETDIPDLNGSAVGNDKISSIRVYSAEWVLLYTDANYGGSCKAFSADKADLRTTAPSFNDVVSSVRIAVDRGSCPAS